jgi:hypothetical protein
MVGHAAADAAGREEGGEVVGGRIGGVELDEGRLDKEDAGAGVHLSPGFFWKEGQCVPVARKTSVEGSRALLMPKTAHERGNAGSQVTRKWRHLRQSGGLSFAGDSAMEEP